MVENKSGKITRIIFLCVIGIMMLFWIVVNINPFKIVNRMIRHFYDETVVTIDMLTWEEYMLYNFEVNADGSITAQDKETWIALSFDYLGVEKVCRLDMYVESSNTEDCQFLVYMLDSYKLDRAYMHEGIVEIPLDKLTSSDQGIRLDIGNKPGNTYKISKIVFNDIQLMTDDFIKRINDTVFGILYSLFLAFVIYVGRELRIKFVNKTGNINILSGPCGWIYCHCVRKKELLAAMTFVAAGISVMMFCKVNNLVMLIIPVLACLYLGVTGIRFNFFRQFYMRLLFSVINVVLMSVFLLIVLIYVDSDKSVWFADWSSTGVFCAYLSLYLFAIAINIRAYLDASECSANDVDADISGDAQTYSTERIPFISIMAGYILVEMMIIKQLCLYDHEQIINNLRSMAKQGDIFINMLLIYLLFLLLVNVVGVHLSNCIMVLLGLIVLFGNLIKIKFQHAILTTGDFKIIKEAVGIADAFISKRVIVLIIFLCVLLVAVCIVFRKKIAVWLKPSFCVGCVFAFPVFAFVGYSFSKGTFMSNYVYTAPEVPETENAKFLEYGVGVYYLNSIMGMSEINETTEPDGYSIGLYGFLDEYAPIESDIDSSLKPDVVLIMAESLSDVTSNQTDVMFDPDPFENMREFQVSNVVSPSYGGRTVTSEYEALTGLSNYTLSGDTVAYTSYINSSTRPIGGLVKDFKDNGYVTTAMHPNVANYYNRDVVYSNLGFDAFLSKSAFHYEKEDLLGDGRLDDEAFFDNVIMQLESVNEPQFIFGVTFAGHSPYITKYDEAEIDIEAYSDTINGNALQEARCYAQTVYELDQEVARLYDYVMKRERPTIVYIWGDHLPALEMYDNYLSDVHFKYTVPIIAFSNYGDIDIGEDFISPNQIATQIIKDTGISHSRYFDFVYDLRKTYPVLQKEWTGNLDNVLEIEEYNYIQYDLLFGKRYLLE